jgi:hypothetical protein
MDGMEHIRSAYAFSEAGGEARFRAELMMPGVTGGRLAGVTF